MSDEHTSAERKVPLWQQLAGAGVGMLVALVCYRGFEFASAQLSPTVSMPAATAEQVHLEEVSSSSEVSSRASVHTLQFMALSEQATASLSDVGAMNDLDAGSPAPSLSPLPPVQATSSSRASVAPLHGGAPRLPGSGAGPWVIVLLSFATTTLVTPHLRKRLFSAISQQVDL